MRPTLVQPLIPLPSSSSTAASSSDPTDPFSELFGAAPASSSKHRRPLTPPPPPSATSSDFGDFVSVPASDHPLAPPITLVEEPLDEDENRGKTEIGRNLLDELLKHEDDPMYFHRGSSSTPRASSPSRSHTPSLIPSPNPVHSQTTTSSPTPEPDQHIVERPSHKRRASASVLAHIQQLADAPFELLRDLSEASLTPLNPPSHPPSSKSVPSSSPPDLLSEDNHAEEDGRLRAHSRDGHDDEHHHHHVRHASLPPSSPTRPSLPELSRTESHSTFAPSTSSRWMNTLLSFAPSSSRSAQLSRMPFAQHASTIPAPISAPSVPMPVPRANTIGRGAGIAHAASSVTHGTPFAPHTFVPPSGAPGFAGDRSWDKGFDFDLDGDAGDKKRNIVLSGRQTTTAEILSNDLADAVRSHLPALARLPTTWRLLYSLDQHGISLQTLYARCGSHKGGAVLAVKDAKGGIFGAWLGEGIHAGRGEGYFGSGESFLWRSKDSGTNDVEVFKWTGKNDYVALCEKEYFALGGGDGTYGLYLDEALFDGSSARCPTFENEVLCRPSGRRRGRTEGFECVGVEVWGVGST